MNSDLPPLMVRLDTGTSTGTSSTTGLESDAAVPATPVRLKSSGSVEAVADLELPRAGAAAVRVATGWPACWTLGEATHPGLALFIMCLYTFFTGLMTQGAIPSVLTTLQALYGLSSYEAGWISSANDVTVCATLIPLGLWAPAYHMPRLLSLSSVLLAGGAVLFGLPYFVFEQGSRQALGMLLAANALMGIGSCTQYVLCNVYFSLIVSKRRLSLYNAIYTAFSTLGPAIGFLVGGFSSTPTLWWVPFFACAVCLVLAAILGWFLPRSRDVSLIKDDSGDPISLPCFPSRAKSTFEERVADNELDSQIVSYFGGVAQRKLTFVQLVRLMFTVIAEPAVFFTVMVSAVGGFLIGAVVTFAPQFGEVSFGLSSDLAAIAFGATAIPGAVLGVVMGGLICKHLNAANEGVLLVIMLASIITVPITPIFLIPLASVFFPLLILIEITSFMPSGLIATVITRIVEPKNRGIGLAMQSLVSRLLGTITGPIVMGRLIDQRCLAVSGEGASDCILYDIEQYRILFFVVIICCAALAALFSVFAWIAWRRRMTSLRGVAGEPVPLSATKLDSGSHLGVEDDAGARA